MCNDNKMNEKHREIEAWLHKIFAGKPVPQYEISERTLEVLSGLKKINEQKDVSTNLIVQDWHLKAKEYRLEAERIGNMLERFGLTAHCLSQSGTVSLKILVDLSLILQLQSATDSELLLAITQLARETMQIDNSQRAEKRINEQLMEQSRSRLQKCTDLKRALEGIESQMAQQGPEMERKAKQAEFLQTKASEYRRSVEQLKRELTNVGFDSSVSHGTLIKKSESLKELKKRLQVVRSKLDSYQSLPPDLSLARVKVEETRQELASLEAELAQHIDLMHM